MAKIKKQEKKFIIVLVIISIIIILGELFYFSFIEDINEKMDITIKEKNGEIVISEELEKNKKLLGLTDVTGEGIIINIDDGSDLIHQEDIIIVLDELKNAGAEAISVNEQRVVNDTYLYCDGGVILIDGLKISNPFVVKAIGNTQNLYESITRNKGYISTLQKYEINVEIEKNNNIQILKTKKEMLDSSKSEIEQLILSNKLIGKSNINGSGIEIKIDTSNTSDITAVNLLQIINDLNCAGANAISINDQRIVNMTDIMDISKEYILVNSVCVSSPYIIKVIGNTDDIKQQLEFENSAISKLTKSGKNVLVTSKIYQKILKYDARKGQNKISISYMK